MATRATQEPRGLKIVSATLRPPKEPDEDLRVSFLEMVIEDELNGRCYDTVLVGTPRGITFTVSKRTEPPKKY